MGHPPVLNRGYAAAAAGAVVGGAAGSALVAALAWVLSPVVNEDSPAVFGAWVFVAMTLPWTGVIVGAGLGIHVHHKDYALRTALATGCLLPWSMVALGFMGAAIDDLLEDWTFVLLIGPPIASAVLARHMAISAPPHPS